MRKKRTKIYVKFTPEKNAIIYSGISFSEFINCLSHPLENILLLKGDYWGNKRLHNFELLEGKEEIEKLGLDDIYNYGDFCFMDYSADGKMQELNNQEIAEMLFMTHMFEPMTSPFNRTLGNRFAYLAHEDGYYCKLYCQDSNDFFHALEAKIRNMLETVTHKKIGAFPEHIRASIKEFAVNGLFIELDKVKVGNEIIEIALQIIGEYPNMDSILNYYDAVKQNTIATKRLQYQTGIWNVCK